MTDSLIQFRQITNRDRLSQNTVNTIAQDNMGFMWFGTQDGLNRYDGLFLKIYKKTVGKKESLTENFISHIFEDKDHNLWIGTHTSGLILYNRMYDNFVTKSSLSILSNEFITSIAEDNESNIWIGTFHNGLFKFNKDSECLVKINLENISTKGIKINQNIMSLLFSRDENILYVGDWGRGLFLIDLNGQCIKCFEENSDSENSLMSNKIICLFKDSREDLWIGTQEGLNRYKIKDDRIENFVYDENSENCITGNNIKCICEDHSGNLWIGTYGEGLSKYDILNNNFANFKVSSNKSSGFNCDTVFSLYVDNSEVLWIGTLGEGLMQYDALAKRFYSIVNENEDSKIDEKNKIRSIHVDRKQNMYIGTFSDGLYCYKKDNGSYKVYKHPEINEKSVNCFLQNGTDNLFIANEKHGLSSLDMNNDSVINYKNILNNPKDLIFSLYINKTADRHLYIGTESEGLKIFDLNKNVIVHDNVIDNSKSYMVKSMVLDSNYSLWVATHLTGLMYRENFSSTNSQLNNSEVKYVDCGNTVWTIYEDADNILWAGTASNGLNQIDINNELVKAYTEEDGLCNNCILGILEDESENLWLSTIKGLSKFNKKDKTFKNYDTSDGLSNLEFNEGAYFKHADGTMYFGGNDGITYFHPTEIKDNPYIPNVVITDFEIFNEPVIGGQDNPFLKKNITYADQINLTYRESVFSFKFASLIFNNPQKNQYAYKMEGFDKDWTYSGARRRVTYTNLNPGDYVFRVKGSNNDGIWNEEGTSIKIHISPPYWKTVWFKGLSFLSFVGAGWLTYRQRLEKLEKETRAQEEFSRKLIEVQESEKKRIADDLHDTIAHEILMSKQKAMMALKHKDDKDRMEKTLEEISELTSATITEVRNIAYGLHPHQLDRLGFTKTIKSIINEVSRSTSIKCVFETDNVDQLLSKESEINLFRVIQEIMSNIIKHSEATEVILKVSKLEDHILILLIDNGKGMNLKGKEFIEAKNGLGISTIAERLKIMNGEVSINSEIKKGTTLRFKIPIKKNND